MDENIELRISNDIEYFYKNIKKFDNSELQNELKSNKNLKYVYELSSMYASDAKSYLEKKDFYTSFSCISYAHGLLDALLYLKGLNGDL
ncbi:DUF357 superfamily protein [Candidatus Mancarchaeum acidiphilum]|uniref:DUF357 superfamily protein n=1 Tax=Candidatus Mancarchaeum acidiphilum TaxID=1920749 RepID=A0A218NM55_9ARCH|nr:DUF357 domain-containing protein [Candidatus Mancarchaeum acidiphilum]ASI13545.1 DUF357 superfamily protein [Candidatus Mancarchaeum acidiphilum]